MRQKLYPRERYPQGHPLLALSLNNLGALLFAQGRYPEAVKVLDAAVQAVRVSPEEIALEHGPRIAHLFRTDPTATHVLRDRAWLLAHGLAVAAPSAELRRCEQAFALAAAVQERQRREVLHREADKLLHGQEAADLVAPHVALLRRLFAAEGKAADLAAAF